MWPPSCQKVECNLKLLSTQLDVCYTENLLAFSNTANFSARYPRSCL